MAAEAVILDRAAEDAKIKALVESSALDYYSPTQTQPQWRDNPTTSTFRRKIGIGMERTTPPQGYICHRCDTPGHFIQHCPTNGDPAYDKKKMKLPTGIPKNMLAVVNADGSYALPTGQVAVLKPDEDAFDKLFEGLPLSSTTRAFPPELHCPLCNQVMRYAVFTSKCCFSSFCDTCIRTYILSSSNTTSKCVCGATNLLADDLLPNKTVRDTINRLLESDTTSSSNNVSSAVTSVHDAAASAAYCPNKPSNNASSPTTTSATSKGRHSAPIVDITHQVQHETANGAAKTGDVSVVKHDDKVVTVVVQESAASHAQDKVCQKLPTSSEPPKKKADKDTTTIPVKMQGRAPQEFPAENYTMPFQQYPSYNHPYWGGMQSAGMAGYMPPFTGAMPYMAYAPGCYGVPFGDQGHPMPIAPPPQRGPSTSGTGFSPAPSVSKEESQALNTPSTSTEAQKSYLKRSKHDGGRRNTDCKSVQEKSNNADIRQPKKVVEPIKNGKNRLEEDTKEVAEHKSNVFSRISFPEDRRASSAVALEQDSSDDEEERHFKRRRPAKYEPQPVEQQEETRYKGLTLEQDPSDDEEERHFKRRRPTRYQPQPVERQEETRYKGLTLEQDPSDDEEERHFKRRRPARYQPQPVERQEETRVMRIFRESTRYPGRSRHQYRDYKPEHGHGHRYSRALR